ncbi:calcium/sodium antiporter [Marinimicrobium sp. ABcell2]|uniref:calcium/sodium antiporter n=1 Tax=Marinimicrobium sp. ABcell2 TaxID=3069751 RepID=UPI0027AF0D39|nr:calcium/sodium antiporter [Marinimicrobium sp. ABcell2]MDQ2076291.1 calcium/sodium antiporter [Marinimicrobium sp. ABcell2]
MLLLLWLLLGLGLLGIGGEALVRGALAAARRLGISPLVAGLVIVGFGTSAPELVVSLEAVLSDRPDVALGNVLGSNIANVLLILGISGVLVPLTISRASLRRDGLAMLGASLLFVLIARDGGLSFRDGLMLLVALFAYLLWAYRTERVAPEGPEAELHQAWADELIQVPPSLLLINLWVVGGLVFLLVGARMFLYGAVGMGEALGVPEAIIGLTVVAVGTSLPELAVAVVAVLRRHADVAVGNVLGSNIFNLLGIAGVSAMVQPLTITGRLATLDQWVMLGAAGALMVFLLSGLRLNRLEAICLLLVYGVYLGAMVP